MKKIAMILDNSFPDKRVEREAKALAENYKVYMFHFESDKAFEKIPGVAYHAVKTNWLIRKSLAVAVDFPLYHGLLASALKRFLAEVKPDIVHVHDMTIAGLVMTVKKQFKIVLDLHENRPEIMRFYPHLSRFPSKYLIDLKRWKMAEIDYVKKADALILVTEEAKEDYQAYSHDITVVPNTIEKAEIDAIEIDETIVKKYEGKFLISYVGDIGLRRGIMDVLKAINILKDKMPDLYFVVVGDSTERKYYDAYISENKLEAYVELAGFQPHAKLFSYIKASEIGVSPLTRNRHHDTTYANKLFQYMAMGKCQIVSDCPSQANLIQDLNCGMVYPAGDIRTLVSQISELYTNAALRHQLQANALEAIRTQCNWEARQQPLLNLYSRL